MVNNEKKINIDYVGVVRERNGQYVYEKEGIAKSEFLIKELERMANNPNRSVLDLLDCFKTQFGKNPIRWINCCWPNAYDDSYVSVVACPEYMSNDEYQKKLVSMSSSSIKQLFLNKALNYIRTVDLNSTIDTLNEQKDVKMTSYEDIGWSSVIHKISDDLTITINTNFGYGCSSYFLLNVCYKDIDILPYSILVKYYYANVDEIKRCTRSYRPDRDNWTLAMSFVADLGNQVKNGELSFVRNWLKNEITEMMSMLYSINDNPMRVIEDIKGRPISLCGLRKVYAMDNDEVKLLSVYPEEMCITFKAVKLSSALSLIDKLRASADIYAPALEAVQQIEDINRLVAPELEMWIRKIGNKLTDLTDEQKLLEEQYELVNEAIKTHQSEIDVIYNEQKVNDVSRTQIDEEYRKNKPELVQLEKESEELSGMIEKVKREVYNRRNFLDTLNGCYKRIEDAKLLCA